MSNPGDHDNSNASGQAAHGSERDGAKTAYDGKQAKDVKESVENCQAETELGNTAKSIRAERQNAANAKTDGEDYDYYNGLSH
jgi:hypothetical protein